MKTISRYIMTLALLLTAVGGAWADETLLVTINSTDNTDFKSGNKTFDDIATVTFGAEVKNDGDNWGWYTMGNDVTLTVTAASDAYTITRVKFYCADGSAFDEEAPFLAIVRYESGSSITKVNGTSIGLWGVTKIEVFGPDPNAIDVTTNAASKQDLFTEASFTMPAFDATVNYMLVRDMQDQANPVTFSGLPTTGDIIVKKGDDGKYQPAETLNLQLIDLLAATDAQNIIAADGITVKVLVGDGGTPIEYDQENPITLEAFLADMKPGYYWIKAEATDENSPYDGTVYSSEFTVVELYDLVVKPANDFSKGKIENVTVGTEEITPDATTGKATKTGIAPDTEVKIKAKRGYIIEKVETGKGLYTMLNAATAGDIGMVVCNKGHLHDAKTAVPAGCTAVGILGKVTTTGHGLILALQDATAQTWDAINGWASASYAGTTLKLLPNDAARGTNLTSYTTLGETAVSDWAVAQKSDYVAIFTNLGSTANINGTTYDGNVNAYITTGVGGTALSGRYWTATKYDSFNAWYFDRLWDGDAKSNSHNVRPVLGF